MKKWIAFVLLLACLGQVGFADLVVSPTNIPLGESQEIFYQFTVDESMKIKKIEGMAYYPAEEAVYLLKEAYLPRNNELFAITQKGFMDPEDALFYRPGFALDFEVDGEKAYVLGLAQRQPYLMNMQEQGILVDENAPNRRKFEVSGNQYARIGLPIGPDLFLSETYHFATLPDRFESVLRFDRELSIGAVFPEVFDFSGDGEKIVAFGHNMREEKVLQLEPQKLATSQNELQGKERSLFVEILTVPTESNIPDQPDQAGLFLMQEEQIPQWPVFEVKAANYGEKVQNLETRDIYTTEDHIIVLFHELNESRAFIQRYTYKGELLDQVETNYRTRRITAGPDGSTLYLQKWFLEEDELQRLDNRAGAWRLEIIQVNWKTETEQGVSTGRMRPLVAERTFGGKTIARFNNQGFGLIKTMDQETGSMDYRAPLKTTKNDVRLQIPYCDLQAKAATGRDLVTTYQGQEIRISMDRFAGDLLSDMPCDTEATVEIHLSMDGDGNVSYTIEFFVVEQVDAMTRLVHRKTIQ